MPLDDVLFPEFQLYNIEYITCLRPRKIFSQFGKNAKFRLFVTPFSVGRCWANVYIASSADRVFTCSSIDAIGVLIGAGIQKTGRNIAPPPQKRPKMSDFGPPCRSGRHRRSRVVNFRVPLLRHLGDQRRYCI